MADGAWNALETLMNQIFYACIDELEIGYIDDLVIVRKGLEGHIICNYNIIISYRS